MGNGHKHNFLFPSFHKRLMYYRMENGEWIKKGRIYLLMWRVEERKVVVLVRVLVLVLVLVVGGGVGRRKDKDSFSFFSFFENHETTVLN